MLLTNLFHRQIIPDRMVKIVVLIKFLKFYFKVLQKKLGAINICFFKNKLEVKELQRISKHLF